jgi:hypothetical protein
VPQLAAYAGGEDLLGLAGLGHALHPDRLPEPPGGVRELIFA